MADGHVCRELRQQINELARAPLPHLREDPTDCRTHLLQVALGPLSPSIRKVHADDAAVVRVDVSGDQPFFLQSGKHCGDAAGAGLQRTGELRRRHGAAQCELVQNEWLAMRTARELLLHLGTVAPHAGVQFAERLPLKTHFAPPSDSTIAALPRSAEYRQYIPAAYTSCKHL